MTEKPSIEDQIKNINKRLGTLEYRSRRSVGEVGHNFLDSLIGKTVMVSLTNSPENSFDAKLISFDEFTIVLVSVSDDKNVTRNPIMYYKHAIVSICEV